MELHNTTLGKNFFEVQLPKLIENLGRIADALENKATLDINKDTLSSDIWTKLTDEQREDIYHMAWTNHVYDDVYSCLFRNAKAPEDVEEFENLCMEVANKYVYDKDYNNNLSYWENIDNLILSVLGDVQSDCEKLDENIIE